MAEGWVATDPHDIALTPDSEEGAQPSYGPAPESAPLVQRSYRPTTPGEKEAVQSALLCFADSRLDSVAPGFTWTTSLTEFELSTTTSSSSHPADSNTSALPSTGQAQCSKCGVPAPLLQASSSSGCDPGESIVLRQNTSGDVGNSGYRYAHWESHPHKKRRDGDDGAGGSGGTAV